MKAIIYLVLIFLISCTKESIKSSTSSNQTTKPLPQIDTISISDWQSNKSLISRYHSDPEDIECTEDPRPIFIIYSTNERIIDGIRYVDIVHERSEMPVMCEGFSYKSRMIVVIKEVSIIKESESSRSHTTYLLLTASNPDSIIRWTLKDKAVEGNDWRMEYILAGDDNSIIIDPNRRIIK